MGTPRTAAGRASYTPTDAEMAVFERWFGEPSDGMSAEIRRAIIRELRAATRADLLAEITARVPDLARALLREIPFCTGCDFDHAWDDHVRAVAAAVLSEVRDPA